MPRGAEQAESVGSRRLRVLATRRKAASWNDPVRLQEGRISIDLQRRKRVWLRSEPRPI